MNMTQEDRHFNGNSVHEYVKGGGSVAGYVDAFCQAKLAEWAREEKAAQPDITRDLLNIVQDNIAKEEHAKHVADMKAKEVPVTTSYLDRIIEQNDHYKHLGDVPQYAPKSKPKIAHGMPIVTHPGVLPADIEVVQPVASPIQIADSPLAVQPHQDEYGALWGLMVRIDTQSAMGPDMFEWAYDESEPRLAETMAWVMSQMQIPDYAIDNALWDGMLQSVVLDEFWLRQQHMLANVLGLLHESHIHDPAADELSARFRGEGLSMSTSSGVVVQITPAEVDFTIHRVPNINKTTMDIQIVLPGQGLFKNKIVAHTLRGLTPQQVEDHMRSAQAKGGMVQILNTDRKNH